MTQPEKKDVRQLEEDVISQKIGQLIILMTMTDRAQI